MNNIQKNFKINQIWISKNRIKYRIVSIDETTPNCWFPILLENCESKVLFTADSKGNIYNNFQALDDNLIMQVSEQFGELEEQDKDLATRMLRIYNEKKKRMEEERKSNNDKLKRSLNLVKRGKKR